MDKKLQIPTVEPEDLFQRLETFAQQTQREAQGIDLSAKVMERVVRQKKHGFMLGLGLSLSTLVATFFFFQSRVDSDSRQDRVVMISAPKGVSISTGTALFQVQGTQSFGHWPRRIETSKEQEAYIEQGVFKIKINPDTGLRRRGEVWELEFGAVAFDTKSPRDLKIQGKNPILLSIHGKGFIAHTSKGHTMNLLKKHKVAVGSALVAIAVYAGWSTISGPDKEVKVEAGNGAYVDKNGNAHTFALQGQDGAGDGLLGLSGVKDGARADTEEEFQPTGAFWDEDQQVVQFRIRGEIFDADTGKTLDGFLLHAELQDSKDFGQSLPIDRRFKELKEGQFSFSGLGLGRWRVRATKQGYAPLIQDVDILDMRNVPYLVIPMSGGAQIGGRVIDWKGQAVAGAKVGLTSCVGNDEKELSDGCTMATSDSQGNFLLEKIPEENTYSLFAKHKSLGFATSNNLKSVVEGAGQHVTIQLSGRVKITGQVVRGKKHIPVVGAILKSGDIETTTGDNGLYEFIVPLEASPTVHVIEYTDSIQTLAIESYPENRSARPLQWVGASTHAAELNINFELAMSRASLSGTILDSRGKPLSGIQIQIDNTTGWMKNGREHETYPAGVLSDKDGHYQIDNIPYEAGYELYYRLNEEDEWKTLGYVNILSEKEVRADFRIGNSSIRGRFVKAGSGEPMSISQSSCSRLGAAREGNTEAFILAHCYPDGRFEILNLMPGTYKIHSKVEWMASSIRFIPKTVILEGTVLAEQDIEIEGEGAVLWRFRILNEKNEFLSGPYIRYQVGNSNTTANLNVGEDGLASQQLNESIQHIFLEVPGYESEEVDLKKHKPDAIIEVHLKKLDKKE